MDKLMIDVSEADRKNLRKKEMQMVRPSFLVVCGGLIVIVICGWILATPNESELGMRSLNIFGKIVSLASFLILCSLVLLWFIRRCALIKLQRIEFSDKTTLAVSDEAIRVNQKSAKRQEISEILQLEDFLFVVMEPGEEYTLPLTIPYFRTVRQEVLAMLKKHDYPEIRKIDSYKEVPMKKKESSII